MLPYPVAHTAYDLVECEDFAFKKQDTRSRSAMIQRQILQHIQEVPQLSCHTGILDKIFALKHAVKISTCRNKTQLWHFHKASVLKAEVLQKLYMRISFYIAIEQTVRCLGLFSLLLSYNHVTVTK